MDETAIDRRDGPEGGSDGEAGTAAEPGGKYPFPEVYYHLLQHRAMRQRTAEYGPTVLRLGLGIIYFVHGVGKLAGVGPGAIGIAGTTGFLTNLGFPAPVAFAWILALVETFGGLALVVGLLTRWVSVALAVDALLATVLVNLPVGFVMLTNKGGWEFTAFLLLALISLVLTGPGALSLEEQVWGEEYLPARMRPAG